MPEAIKKIAVLGTGVMGSQIAAHFANAGIPVLAFDISQKIAEKGLQALQNLKPSPYFEVKSSSRITPCNYKEHLERLDEADWIIETVIENLDIKSNLFNKILHYARPETIISSNTSGLTLKELSQWMPPEFTEYFLVTHFLNPPRYMHLVEVIHNEYTQAGVVKKVVEFCENILGKGVVVAKDTPNFIANRLGTYIFMMTLAVARKLNLPVEAVDQLTGPLIGRPPSATFRTADMVGLDTLATAAAITFEKCPHDESRQIFRLPGILEKMLEQKRVGQKSSGGFYKEEGTLRLSLNLNTLEYAPLKKIDLKKLARVRGQRGAAAKIKALVDGNDMAGKFAWEILANTLIYAANRVPEVSDEILNIDNAMKWGFGWELGPFETWEALGLQQTAARMKAEGRKVPLWIEAMIRAGVSSFYTRQEGRQSYFDINRGQLRPVIENPRVISLQLQKEKKGALLLRNDSASLIDLEDGVLCAEFHHPHEARSNLLNPAMIDILEEALEIIPQKSYKGLLIASQAANFCAGADADIFLKLCRKKAWEKLNVLSKAFQEIGQRLRYAPFPVVSAPYEKTLGAGLELALAADCRVAAAEFYGGLNGGSAGLFPCGGGILRILGNLIDQEQKNLPGPFPPVKKAFDSIFCGRVSSSAAEALKMGCLQEGDRIVINPAHLIYEAKQTLLKMAENYVVPQPYDHLLLPGEGGRLALEVHLDNLLKRGEISVYDCLFGKKLAYVLTGGEKAHPITPLREQTFLDLEREAFVNLCQEPQAQERLAHFI